MVARCNTSPYRRVSSSRTHGRLDRCATAAVWIWSDPHPCPPLSSLSVIRCVETGHNPRLISQRHIEETKFKHESVRAKVFATKVSAAHAKPGISELAECGTAAHTRVRVHRDSHPTASTRFCTINSSCACPSGTRCWPRRRRLATRPRTRCCTPHSTRCERTPSNQSQLQRQQQNERQRESRDECVRCARCIRVHTVFEKCFKAFHCLSVMKKATFEQLLRACRHLQAFVTRDRDLARSTVLRILPCSGSSTSRLVSASNSPFHWRLDRSCPVCAWRIRARAASAASDAGPSRSGRRLGTWPAANRRRRRTGTGKTGGARSSATRST